MRAIHILLFVFILKLSFCPRRLIHPKHTRKTVAALGQVAFRCASRVSLGGMGA
jgi:hypothetical protein